jgi:hypothetical protein
VYTFSTRHAHGLICVGKHSGDLRYAHVSLDEPDGRIAVGFYIHLKEKSKGTVLEFIKPILNTFRFKIDSVDSKEQIKRLIEEAGIPTREE